MPTYINLANYSNLTSKQYYNSVISRDDLIHRNQIMQAKMTILQKQM